MASCKMPHLGWARSYSRGEEAQAAADQAGAGAGDPKPGSILGGEGFITSGSGVAACAPVGGLTWNGGGGAVNVSFLSFVPACSTPFTSTYGS